MQTVQVGQFKAEFSSILDQVQNMGEKFIIEYGKQHKKVAMLVPFEEETKKRVFGIYKGKYEIPDNFDDEDEEINAMFYGSLDEDID
jgi:antitoxin (DNA-binding transcriptional repressor) of toxin-antitoxin stability system